MAKTYVGKHVFLGLMATQRIALTLAAMALVFFSGCGGGTSLSVDPDSGEVDAGTVLVEASVTGLSPGNSLTLSDNLGHTLVISNNGVSSFTNPIAVGPGYTVSVQTQPVGQVCSLAASLSPVVAGANVLVQIVCSTTSFEIGGAVSGLIGANTVSLELNGTNTRVVGNGAVNFGQVVAFGGSYSVTVAQQPAGQTCTVGNGSGSNVQASVSNVQVTCVSSLSIIGSVSGLGVGKTVSFVVNAGAPVTVSANGSATIANGLTAGSAYTVTIAVQPSRQTCTLTDATGTVSASVATVFTAVCADNPIFAFVANGGGNSISVFRINASTGSLVAVSSSPFAAGTNPKSLAVHPSGSYIYAANGVANTLSAFNIHTSTGALTAAAGSPYAAGANLTAVTVDPLGRFVYLASATDDNIATFAIDSSTGVLNTVSSVLASNFPNSLAAATSGQYVYAANRFDTNVLAYTVDANGTLTPMAGSPFAADEQPISITVDPSGRFIFVANTISNNISAYTIDASSGALNAVAGSPFAAGSEPRALTVDPLGRFLFVANRSGASVSVYTINASTGVLTQVVGSPFSVGSDPESLAVEPSGQFIYVANILSNSVGTFRINASTGALSTVGSAVASGLNPNSIVIHQRP